MKKLLRAIVGVLALCVLTLATAPVICGVWLQYRIQQEVASLQDTLASHNLQGIFVKVVSFERAWFSSDYVMKLGWKGSEQAFFLHHTLYHGPITHMERGLDEWRFGLASGVTQVDFPQLEWPFAVPRLSVEGAIDFAGNTELEWRFPGYRGEHQQDYLNVTGSSGEFYYSSAEQRAYGQLNIPDIQLRLDALHWSLTGLKSTFDFSQGDSVLPVGELSVNLSQGRVQDGAREFRLKNINQLWRLAELNRLSSIQWGLQAGLLANKQVTLEQVNWDAILRGISELSLAALKPEIAPSSFKQWLDTLRSQVKLRTPELLSGTEFEVTHFETQVHQGTAQGFVRMQVPELREVANTPSWDLLKTMDMSAELSVPVHAMHRILADTAIQKKFQLPEKYRYLKRKLSAEEHDPLNGSATAQPLQLVVTQGILHQDQSRYWSSIQLRGGDLTFNGYPVHGF